MEHAAELKTGPEIAEKTIGKGRAVRINQRESPLGWLAARGLIDRRQIEAGERLRADYEAAAMGPRVTMQWDRVKVDGGGRHGYDGTGGSGAAKRRFDEAIRAAGPGLGDVLWRVVCGLEPLPEAERGMGWPARSGRVVLGLALDRLADHYRLG